MEPVSELRRSKRRRTLFGGALFDADDNRWECFVSDISETGAKIRSKANLEVGTFADLKINKFNDLRRAEVVWAGDGVLGLRFLIKIDRDQKGMAEFFKLIGD